MRITDLLSTSGIELNGKGGTKQQTIDQITDLMDKTGNLSDKETYKKAVEKREEEGTTGIGDGIAIPHGKSSAVIRPGLAAMVIPGGTDYDSMDGQPTDLIFEIAVPENSNDEHLEMLSRLSMMLMDPQFKKDLLAAKSAEQFLTIIDEKEREKFGEEELKEEDKNLDAVERGVMDLNEKEMNVRQAMAEEDNGGYPNILAVTACPTGIAHTYMAAEALQNTAEQKGYTIKVETNGSGGTKNKITPQEIKHADAVIIAADKKVDVDRFAGLPVIQVAVKDGIHRPAELIDMAMSGNAPILQGHGGATEIVEENESVWRKIYKDLMNGVSNMLPFVIGGGILIAIAFLLDDYSINPAGYGSNTPVAAFFKMAGDAAFGFMLPVLAGYIAMSIADRPGFMPGFIGGYLAKEGFVFANGTITTGGTSGFLGALVAGFAVGYMMLYLEKLCDHLPDAIQGTKPTLIYPVIGLLLTAAGMVFIINPPVAWLNQALSNGLQSMGGSSKILLGAVLGAMMATDMGGPFNKAAYVFGTAMLADNQFDIMAAVMVGGMVPPIGIALASTFFKNRFTKSERDAGITNYIMGLCFITEGAIPFAAADPARVIPSCMAGSAVAGAISMMVGAQLRAPHGGVFVFPVVTNWPMYFVALIVGSLVTMALLAILKKPIKENA